MKKQKLKIKIHVPFKEHSLRHHGGWAMGIAYNFKTAIVADDMTWQWNDRTLSLWLFAWRVHVHCMTDIRPFEFIGQSTGFPQSQERRESESSYQGIEDSMSQ